MDASMVRKAVEFNPRLLAACKEMSAQTGLSLDNLINLALYDLGRRMGIINPQSQSIPPPAGADLLDQEESPPPPRRKQPPAAPVKAVERAAPVPMAGKQAGEVLYFQLDDNPSNPIRKDVFLVGRGSKCDCVIQHRSVSREHAVISRERGGWFIEDLNSANGTWIGGEQIGKHRISEGDEVQISNFCLRFSFRRG